MSTLISKKFLKRI